MNKMQSRVIVAGVVATAGLFLFPAWSDGYHGSTYRFIFSAPHFSSINLLRTLFPLPAIALAFVLGVWWFKDWRVDQQPPPAWPPPGTNEPDIRISAKPLPTKDTDSEEAAKLRFFDRVGAAIVIAFILGLICVASFSK